LLAVRASFKAFLTFSTSFGTRLKIMPLYVRALLPPYVTPLVCVLFLFWFLPVFLTRESVFFTWAFRPHSLFFCRFDCRPYWDFICRDFLSFAPASCMIWTGTFTPRFSPSLMLSRRVAPLETSLQPGLPPGNDSLLASWPVFKPFCRQLLFVFPNATLSLPLNRSAPQVFFFPLRAALCVQCAPPFRPSFTEHLAVT